MKSLIASFLTATTLGAVLLFTPVTNAVAQSTYHAQTLDVKVTGTSSLHDWEMKSSKGKFDATITVANEKVSLGGLSFSLPAESLKSGHNGMDKNTYKALNTTKNPSIQFVLVSANVTPSGNNTYLVKGLGKLTIAGNTKQTEVVATLKYNPADKSFTCTGTKSFKMSEYGVKPPTVMMGAIKTGDAISISYNLNIKS